MDINKIARKSSKFRVIFTVPDFCWAPSCSACRTSMPTVRRGCITTSSGIMSLMPGRFVNQDPIGLLGGENLYGFVPNTQNWIDILGLKLNKKGDNRLNHLYE